MSQLVKIIAISLVSIGIIRFSHKYINSKNIEPPTGFSSTGCDGGQWRYDDKCHDSGPCPERNLIVTAGGRVWKKYTGEYTMDEYGVYVCKIKNIPNREDIE